MGRLPFPLLSDGNRDLLVLSDPFSRFLSDHRLGRPTVLGGLDRPVLLQGVVVEVPLHGVDEEVVGVILFLPPVVGQVVTEERGLGDVHLLEQYVAEHLLLKGNSWINILKHLLPPVPELRNLGGGENPPAIRHRPGPEYHNRCQSRRSTSIGETKCNTFVDR